MSSGPYIHTDWTTPGFELDPVGQKLGPFPHRGFLQTWWQHRRPVGIQLALTETSTALLPLSAELGPRTYLRFLGEAGLADYHSPLGSVFGPACAALSVRYSEPVWQLDSLPYEAAQPLAEAIEQTGGTVSLLEETVAAVLDLPATFDDYLTQIGKKQRHEVRRKIRRYEQTVGPVRHHTNTDVTGGFSEFVRLYRKSTGPKGAFLTEPMAAFFADLLRSPGWRLDLLYHPDSDLAIAALLGYSDREGYYLYNSAYDPSWSASSPGWVMLTSMIEQAIAEGLTTFDFLKGDEGYKFRLGAQTRKLYQVNSVSSDQPIT